MTTALSLIAVVCLLGCIEAQNITNTTCGDMNCPGYPISKDSEGNNQDQCCKYLGFVDGCCSQEDNDQLLLIRNVIIGVCVGVAALLAILIIICICCCFCIFCDT